MGITGAAPDEPRVLMKIQLGLIHFGVAMGAVFAVVYSVSMTRVGNVSPRNLALLVAGGLFLGVYLVPFLKYPANPPSIGHPDTISPRTGLYLLMVVCSLGFGLGAVILGRRLAPRFGNWNATLMAAGAFIVAIGIVMLFCCFPRSGICRPTPPIRCYGNGNAAASARSVRHDRVPGIPRRRPLPLSPESPGRSRYCDQSATAAC